MGFFMEADEDRSGMLSWEEFRKHLQNTKVKAFFQALELDVSQARALFQLLDADHSNQVGLDEFLDGCMRLKGQAKSIDVNMLMYKTDKVYKRIQEDLRRLENGVIGRSSRLADFPEQDTSTSTYVSENGLQMQSPLLNNASALLSNVESDPCDGTLSNEA